MSTPGRRRALKALAARKRSNKRRIKRGERPVLNDKRGRPKRVSLRTFRQRTSKRVAARKARRSKRRK